MDALSLLVALPFTKPGCSHILHEHITKVVHPACRIEGMRACALLAAD